MYAVLCTFPFEFGVHVCLCVFLCICAHALHGLALRVRRGRITEPHDIQIIYNTFKIIQMINVKCVCMADRTDGTLLHVYMCGCLHVRVIILYGMRVLKLQAAQYILLKQIN